MRLVNFWLDSGLRAGAVRGDDVYDLLTIHEATTSTDWEPTPEAVIAHGTAGLPVIARLLAHADSVPQARRHRTQVRLGPCVAGPSKIICIGLNYRRHAEEAGMPVPEAPLLFSKFANTLTGDRAVVNIPPVTTQTDYEVELAVVIGRQATAVNQASAREYVLGFATANDLTARDLQFRTSQWLLGKSLDGFLPIGPELVTTDEVPNPQALRLRTWVNGELRQDSSTSDMIFSIDEIVAYVSRHMTLIPGDVILTGTPPGVISGMPEKPWLRDGDLVSVEIEGLGRLSNTFEGQA